MSRIFRMWRAIAILLAVCSVPPLLAQSAIQYMYDEIGRLIAVVDPGGDTATYTYDAVGNLLAISRYASTQVSIVSFTPASGPVGTVVKVRGTGFSTPPASNTVTFNGTNATVSAATTTELTVTVPGGATTGTIAVTAPGGSDTGDSAFTVTSATAPTITSFTPAIGVAGASVSITGTNFDTTALKNRLQFNLTSIAASSSTSTSISTTAPTNTASGPIKVSTAFGQAVSTADFFIAPYPYGASDVVYTGRMGFSDSEAVAITTAGKIGLAVFDATAGQRVSVKIVPGPASLITLYRPDGTTLATKNTGIFTELIEPKVMPRTGTYTVNVDPSNPSITGTVAVTAYDMPADLTGTITTDGTATNAVITTPGQNGTLTFSGTSGQRVSLVVSEDDTPGGTVSLKTPDGSTMSSIGSGCCTSHFMEPQTLPTTGTYSLFIDPSYADIGTVTLNLYDMPADVTGSIATDGSATNVVITTPGQNGTLTFSGTSGQVVSLSASEDDTPHGTVYLKKPDGSTLGSILTGCCTPHFLEPVTLPTTGTYSVFVDPYQAEIGTITLNLYIVAADVTGSIATDGTATNVVITTPGQNGTLTFSGTSGQRVSLKVSEDDTPDGTVYLKKPDGSTLTSIASGCCSPHFREPQTLPTTGTYSLFVDPYKADIGTVTLNLYDVPADASGSLTIGGSAVAASLPTPGQNGSYTFSGTASQQVTVRVTGNNMSVLVTLKKPDGTTLTSKNSSSASFNLTQQTLPTTGTYTVVVDPQGASAGGLNLSVTSP